jgi:CBS-domain-containing membrane protein
MIPLEDYPHIPYWFTLRQAIAEMEKTSLEVKGRKSLPRALLVFDEKYNLLGIVRRRDILRGLEPKFLRTMAMPSRKQLFEVEVDPNLADLSSGRVAKAMQEQAEQPVSEVMQGIAATVGVDDHLAKIIYKMITRDLTLLPVLRDTQVVGVVRSVDVFEEVADMLL